MPIKISPVNLELGFDKFVRTDNGTEQMAVDGRSTQAEDVWDGTGDTDTGSDWTRGGSGSESTDAAHSGTNGLNTGILSENDVWWFDYGSNRDMDASFDSISFWINPQAHPIGSVLRCGWTAAGDLSLVGNSVKVSDYIPNADLNVWQRVSIPLIDFNLTSNVGRLIFQARQTDSQKYYIDDIDLLNSTGDGPYRFRISGESNLLKHVSRIILVIAAPETGWNSSAFADISGGLELGMIIRKGNISTLEVEWSITMKNNVDLFGQMTAAETVHFPDGELMVVFNLQPSDVDLILTDDDALEVVIRDDLSTLNNVRAYLLYGSEESYD